MRLMFNTTSHMNTDISDEQGNIQYTISTSSAPNKVTTITKYRWNSPSAVPEMMGVIEWHRVKETVFRFDGKVIPANVMLKKRAGSTGRYFIGPDQHTYKWKVRSPHCWMKPDGSNLELVRFHKKNLGVRKLLHPAYIDVSTKVVPMLDHIILTFVYVESLRQAGQPTKNLNMNNLNNMSNMSNTSNTNNMNMINMINMINMNNMNNMNAMNAMNTMNTTPMANTC